MTDSTMIGRRIGAYLKLEGRKLGWFAERMNWSNEKASMILNGKRQLGLMDFFKACHVLGASTEQFITDEDVKE